MKYRLEIEEPSPNWFRWKIYRNQKEWKKGCTLLHYGDHNLVKVFQYPQGRILGKIPLGSKDQLISFLTKTLKLDLSQAIFQKM